MYAPRLAESKLGLIIVYVHAHRGAYNKTRCPYITQTHGHMGTSTNNILTYNCTSRSAAGACVPCAHLCCIVLGLKLRACACNNIENPFGMAMTN